MAADLASGQPHLVVAQGKALKHPSEEAVHLVASALLDLDAQATAEA